MTVAEDQDEVRDGAVNDGEDDAAAGEGTPGGGKDSGAAETVAYWKAMSRKNEDRAKANAEAARRLKEIEDAAKTDAQRAADALAEARREAEQARADADRYKAAAMHGITGDDIDLLGSGPAEEIESRAVRIGQLLKAERDLAAQQNSPAARRRPAAALRSGAAAAGTEPGTSPEAEADAAARRLGLAK